MDSNKNTLPKHVGIILDGNRRWAKQKNLPTLEGHRRGAENFKEISLQAFDRGIEYLSAFVFSTENWSRTEEEVGYLMDLVMKAVDKYLNEYHERGIKILILGRREGVRSKVLEAIVKAEARTADNTNGTLALCFNYGGREEIVDAVKSLISSGVTATEVTAEKIQAAVYGPEVPNVDLLIRTGGEQRTSGYMLWRADYAELAFSDKFWPDFNTDDLDNALADYEKRQRRFGT